MYETKTTAELQQELLQVLEEERDLHDRIRRHRQALEANELYRHAIVAELRRRQNPTAPTAPASPTRPDNVAQKIVEACRRHANKQIQQRIVCDARR